MTDDLDTLLRRHGQTWQDDFTPPPLAPMLETATGPSRGHRWVPALVAAVLILAIPIGTVVALHHNRAVGPATDRVFVIPDTITEKGKTLHRFDDADWSDAVVSADGKQVTVLADVDTIAGCGVPPIRGFVSAETGESVTIAVDAYHADAPSPSADTPTACFGVGHSPEPVAVTLQTALGNRRLIDLDGGETHAVLRSQSMPQPAYLPAGYSAGQLTWDETGRNRSVVRTYPLAPAPPSVENAVTVTRWVSPAPPTYEPQILAHGIVLGHAAVIQQSRNFPDSVCAQWSDSTYDWLVCSSGYPTAPLGADELLKIANSLR